MAATMTLHIDDPAPLRVDADGVVRVGKTRVALDLVVRAYEGGMAADDIVRGYDVLQPADVYGALAYYFRHRDEVDAYLQQRDEEAARLRAEVETVQRPGPSKTDLLARRQAREAGHAEARQ